MTLYQRTKQKAPFTDLRLGKLSEGSTIAIMWVINSALQISFTVVILGCLCGLISSKLGMVEQ